MTETLVVRDERPGDAPAINALHRAAFGGEAEAQLVDELRADGSAVLSLVAEEQDRIVGHVAYSRLTIDGDAGGALALAPISVAPDRQRRGIGSKLIETAHRRLAAAGEQLVFVVGDPAWYRRFGFSAPTARPFRTPYDGEHMMALALGSSAPSRGAVAYPAPFARLG